MAFNMSIEFSNPSFLKVISSTQFFFMSILVGLFMGSSKVVLLIAACNRASHEVSGLHLWCACSVLVSAF
jgi:hypothetical protein